jgi:UDP-galactopyranose mutase
MPSRTRDVLIVGCGFAGAVYARQLADAGLQVTMIDQRSHIAGNAYDEVDGHGVRVHRYGPHLFHTNNDRVVEWLAPFATWEPYVHRVRASLGDNLFVPIPVNIATVNQVFGLSLSTEAEMTAFLASVAEKIDAPRNAADYLNSRIGRRLTDLFFRPYTKKMWSLDLEDMDQSVVRRIPIRYDHEDRYFPNDRHQMLPRDGYTALFKCILDSPRISVHLNTSFDRQMEKDYDYVFNSMPIDEYFDFQFGELPYRSIRFHTKTVDATAHRDWSVTNYTDEGIFTRETWWHLLPHHVHGDSAVRTVTVEEPCDYRDNALERYYPVKTADGRFQNTYARYKALADQSDSMAFIGRCGTYQYLDMDQVINQSLAGSGKWLMEEGHKAA